MLSYNVSALLRATPGTERRYPIEVIELSIADDLRLAKPIEGEVRLSRTGRSIIARAHVTTAIDGSCARCLQPVVAPIEVSIEEEALPSVDINTGLPLDKDAEPDALRLDDHHELDLVEPIREAISLAEPITILCRPDCMGLCLVCGIDLNNDPDHKHSDDDIDPRFAALADWQTRR
ncbi:MAG TPA: DUF177 domain-containing protein [Candidatus Limnocylindrales bacterium]|nr:DUF177 domain-containing protein [Candidatus Limnocylindrales bacterium]